jgi:hypothetical protein
MLSVVLGLFGNTRQRLLGFMAKPLLWVCELFGWKRVQGLLAIDVS